MKRRVVIVGAGLSGCFLANKLADTWDVTMVELGSKSPTELQSRIKDTDRAALTYPHVGSGLGGTTQVWHNGLIEIDETLFQQNWPFAKQELMPYYEAAYEPLAHISYTAVKAAAVTLREKLTALGMPHDLLGQELFYPSRRINAWHRLGLSGRVKLITGEVTALIPGKRNLIKHIIVRSGAEELQISADAYVLCAGGLSSPLMLQQLSKSMPLESLQHAGVNYQDHPSAFVGEVVLTRPLYKLWNYPVLKGAGSLRLPMVVEQDGLKISFQLRPGSYFRFGPPRDRVVSVLNTLRNQPLKLHTYFQLLSRWDDVYEILSFKFGVHLPTRIYSLLIVAEQPSSTSRALWRNGGDNAIYRKWTTSESYIDTLSKSIDKVLESLSSIVTESRVFNDWHASLFSSSHHSGTARLSRSPSSGVCDENNRVHGLGNLYVCDGSVIPSSGHANTGLTIAALALRLADHLNEISN